MRYFWSPTPWKQTLARRTWKADEAIAAAVRLLRQHEEAEEAHTLEAIRQGLEDMRAGRGRPAEEVFADIRREFNLSPDA